MKKSTAAGHIRFKKLLEPLEILLTNAGASDNPAPFLYTNKARDILFRLEALCRIYRAIHNKKLFDEMNDDFKDLEDAMGSIDYYDAFEKEFLKVKTLPPAFINYFIEGRNKAQDQLNKILLKKKWISESSKKIKEIELSLEKADWLESAEERNAIGQFLVTQIDNFTSKYEKGKLHFNDIEKGIHEFRRKLRWFSIYAASLDGLIQLKSAGTADEDLKKYLSPEIINSPFNVLPEPTGDIHPFYIHDQLFYALSWTITETGKLKDEGLRNEVIHTASEFAGVPTIEVIDKLNIIGGEENEKSTEEICAQAEILADTFIYKDRVMEKIKRDLYRGLEN